MTLSTRIVGHRIEWHASLGSTMDAVRELADRGAAEGVVVACDEQLAGRGRHGRVWHAPPGTGLLFSTLFRPPTTQVSEVAMLSALAVSDGVLETTGVQPAIKWPNDWLVDGKKLGGLLVEAYTTGDRSIAIVGVGLNVNQTARQLPADCRRPATSLRLVCGAEIDRRGLLIAILECIEARYIAMRRGLSPISEWADRLHGGGLGLHAWPREWSREPDPCGCGTRTPSRLDHQAVM
jgi:BirA family biotin operon repressor/biotin-[acetyl-CoA-carboxylase] ligase